MLSTQMNPALAQEMTAPTLTRLPPSSQPGDVVSILQRDGGVIIEDFLTDEQLDGIRADLLPKMAALPAGSEPRPRTPRRHPSPPTTGRSCGATPPTAAMPGCRS